MSEGSEDIRDCRRNTDERSPLQDCDALVRVIDDALVELGPGRELVTVNDAMVELTGYPREQLLGKSLSTILADESDLGALESLRAPQEGTETRTLDLAVETAAGDTVPCELTASPIRHDGRFQGWIGVVGTHPEDAETTAATSSERGPGDSHTRPSQSESIVEDVIDSADVGLFVLDENDRVTWANETIERYFGLDRESVLGRDKPTVVEEELRDIVDDDDSFVRTVLETYETDVDVEEFECRITPGENREERWLEHHSKPIDSGPYAGGRVELYYDVTDRKRSEEARQEDRSVFESVVEAVEEYAIFTLDAEGYVQTWNPGAERIKGYEADEILGTHFSTFYTDEDRATGVPETNLAAAAEAGSVEDEGWRVRQDGSRFWANVTITAIRDDDGALEGFAKVTRDMSDRREREQAIRHERDLFENVLETTPTGIGIFDTQGEALRVNGRFSELLGLNEDPAVYELGDQSLLDEDGTVIPYPERPAPRALETDDPVLEQRVQVQRNDGRTRWLSINASPFHGDPDGVVVTLTDVTTLTQQAQRLEGQRDELRRRRDELERELEDVFERIDDAFYAVDDEFRFTYVNERAEELLQRSGEELLGESLWELYPEATETDAWEAFHTALETQEPTTFDLYFDPLEFWVVATVYPSKTGLSVYFRDVTEQKERQREFEKSERRYRTLAEHFPNGIVTLFDDELKYTLAAGQGFEMIPADPADLEGQHVRDARDEQVARTLEPAFRAVLDGDDRSIELEYEGREWLLHAVPITDDSGEVFAGMTMAQDITDRKERQRRLLEREQELGRYREFTDSILDGIDDIFYVVDQDGTFLRWNDTLCEMTGYTDDEIGSMHPLEFFEEDQEKIADGMAEVFETGRSRVEARLLNKENERIPMEFVGAALENPEGERVLAGIGRDLTERKRRERKLEQYRAFTQAASDVIVTIDERSIIQSVNPSVENLFGYEQSELLGDSLTKLMPEKLEDAHRTAVERYLATGERTLDWDYLELPGERADGSRVPLAVSFSDIQYDGERYFTGIIRDITDRRERERELARRERQQQVVAEFGQYALETDDIEEMTAEASRLVAETLEIECATVFEFDPEVEKLHLRHGVGRQPEAAASRTITANDCSPAGRSLYSDGPVVVESFEEESRFSSAGLRSDDDAASGIWTSIGSPEEPWGVLEVLDADSRTFSDEEIDFVETVSNMLATAIERSQGVRQLEEQRERLAALNSLYEVVQGVSEAVIERSSREEIEQATCELLAASASYTFAWIAEVDPTTQSISPRVESGVEGYLEEIELSADPEEVVGLGPAGRAVRRMETQTSTDVFEDPTFEPWREAAETYGYRSFAAIPIIHNGALYGLLGLCSDRVGGFAEEERAVIDRLGEIIGHGIAAIQRQRAMQSDEVVEVELRIRDFFDTYDVSTGDGRITIDRIVTINENTQLIYGTATPEAIQTLTQLTEAVDHWNSLSFGEQADGPVDFEIGATRSPLVSTVTSYGGTVESAHIEHADCLLTIQLPPGVDVRRVLEGVEQHYPNVEPLARRQVHRQDDDTRQLTRTLLEDLTDRQRTALETAYYGGFYEWPRESTGEELADQLDISAATFSQHLREAQRKLLETVFQTLPTTG
jgi:PAS domain S-box-containing protein